MICSNSNCATNCQDDAVFCHRCGEPLINDLSLSQNPRKPKPTIKKRYSLFFSALFILLVGLLSAFLNNYSFIKLFNKSVIEIAVVGSPAENQKLTAMVSQPESTFSNEKKFTIENYRWLASLDGTNWDKIGTGDYIILTSKEVGKRIKVISKYVEDGTENTIESKPSTVVANVDDPTIGIVTITGTASEDQLLNASNNLTDVDGTASIAYQWQSSSDGKIWANINTGNSLNLTDAEVGKQIRVIAIHTDKAGTAQHIPSSTTDMVSNLNDAPTGEVKIDGNAQKNQVLKATNNLGDEDGINDINFQWQSSQNNADWENIGTGITFTVSDAQIGKKIRVIASYVDAHSNPEKVTSSPVEVIAIDENLFLIRALEMLYAEWPELNAKSNINDIHQWIQQTRENISSIQGHIAGKPDKLDQRINSLYENCIELLTNYEKFLLEISSLQNSEFKISNSSVPNSVGHLASMVFPQYALFTGAAIAINDLIDKDKATTEAEKLKINEIVLRANAINSQLSATYKGAKSLVSELKTDAKYHWNEEAGFDGSLAEKLSYTEQLKKRPKDPFIYLSIAKNNLNAEKTVPIDELIRSSKLVDDAAENLVPDNPVYLNYKANLIYLAAEVGLMVSYNQIQGIYSNGPAPYAKKTIELLKKYMKLAPNGDNSKLEYVQLARAFAMNKNFDEAIITANVPAKLDKWQKDIGFVLRYAKLMSLTNETKLASDWLNGAYKLGYSDVASIRNNPDFSPFRKANPVEFEKLTNPNTNARIKFRPFFDDDVILENNSPFLLTNVNLKGKIKQNDSGREWSIDLSIENNASLAPATQYTWQNAVRINQSRYDSFDWHVTCDQCN